MKRLTLSLLGVLLLSVQGEANPSSLFLRIDDAGPMASLTRTDEGLELCLDAGDGTPAKCEHVVFPVLPQATGTITLDFGNAQTINVTAAQRTKLQRLLDDSNAARAANGQAAQTMEQWLRAKLIDTVMSEIRQAEAHEQAEACAAYQGLSTANQNAIKTALGGKSPCR